MYVAAFNRIGTTAYAAYQAANSLFNIFNFASFSVGDAALILVGEKLGEGNKKYAWELSGHILKVAVKVGLVLGATVIVLSKPLSLIFNLSDQGKTYTFYILIVFGATMAIDLINGVLIAGVLRAGGDTRFTMLVECGSIWLIAVPLAFMSAIVWHLPIHLALLMTRTESLIKVVILSSRYRSKKWMNTVIENL
jgi:Na+-driven multidrug efflux pump